MTPVFRLTNAEEKLAELIWAHEPVASMELVRLARSAFDWKQSTTFTNLRFLIEKGLAQNEKSCVTMLYTHEKIIAEQSCRYVDDAFGGSLPMFVASFASSRKLTPEQIEELKRLIESHEEGSACHG